MNNKKASVSSFTNCIILYFAISADNSVKLPCSISCLSVALAIDITLLRQCFYDLYLNHYLYDPYAGLGGNGSAARIIEEVKRLPIQDRPVDRKRSQKPKD